MTATVLRTAGPMTRDELWEAVHSLSRVLGEAQRRGLRPEDFDRLDVARGIVLGLYSTAPDQRYTERMVV